MSSKLDIANLALTHLGAKIRGITSFAENTPQAIACNNFFIPSRDDVFSESNWPFASAAERLVTTSDLVLGWNYIYLYPPKAARVWSIYNASTYNKKHEQSFEVKFIPSSNRRVICTNLSEAYADYTYKVEDTSIYDPKFVIALSYRLAAAICVTLTNSSEMAVQLMNVFNAMTSEAKRISGVEKKNKPDQTSSYVESR